MRHLIVAILLIPLARAQEAATPRDLASLLPRGASIYADLDGTSDAAARLAASAIVAELEAGPRERLQAALGQLAAARLSRAAIAVLPAIIFTTHWVVVVDTADPDAFLATFEKLRKENAKDSDAPKPATARIASFTVIADCQDTIDDVVAIESGKDKSLAGREDFRAFRARYPRGALRFHLQIDRLWPRIARFGLDGKKDAGDVLFLTQVRHVLKTATLLSGCIDLDRGVGFSLAAEVEPMSETRPFTDSRPSQPVVAPPAGTVLRFSLARDLKRFWEQRDTLLGEGARASLAEFQTNLSTLMGGLSVDDVFAGLGSAFDFYVTRGPATVPEGRRFPAAALVAVVASPALRSELLLSFQTTIGIVNAQRTQEAQPRFLQESSKHRDVTIACARILPESVADPADDRLQLEPTLAVVSDRLIFGTNRAIVASLVDQVLDGRFQPRQPGDGAEGFGPAAAGALADAAAWVRARMILERGTSEAAAQKTLDAIGRMLAVSDQGRVSLDVGPKLATFDLRVVAPHLLDRAPESRR